VICGQGPSPRAATIAAFQDLGHRSDPGTGLLPAVVPGAFDAWCLLLRDWGTWEFADVLSFAIGYARNGIHLVPRVSATIENMRPLFERNGQPRPPSTCRGGKVPGRAPVCPPGAGRHVGAHLCREAAGPRVRRASMRRARLVSGLRRRSVDRFFRGTDVLDVTGRRHRGLLTADDFARWSATVEDPVRTTTTVTPC
jgi:gamma-glutamyltranspeptidase/glutathione hydrolase